MANDVFFRNGMANFVLGPVGTANFVIAAFNFAIALGVLFFVVDETSTFLEALLVHFTSSALDREGFALFAPSGEMNMTFFMPGQDFGTLDFAVVAARSVTFGFATSFGEFEVFAEANYFSLCGSHRESSDEGTRENRDEQFFHCRNSLVERWVAGGDKRRRFRSNPVKKTGATRRPDKKYDNGREEREDVHGIFLEKVSFSRSYFSVLIFAFLIRAE
ncbi:MAG: hypothetical protein H6728_17190 [Myxococcales bacterium]|nr:hypothetical protein [Myxococcales bacterium]MCB9644810.1 hypothetical protein [Myxococcales bacterium]